MTYPLLVPREYASQCLQYEQELRPLVGIVAPDPANMRGRGCTWWKGTEVYVTDDNPPELIDRLKQMKVEVIVVGPVDWDNLETWRVEAMKRLPIARWFRGAKSVSHASIMLAAAIDGRDGHEAALWIRNAALAGIITRKKTRWGPLYSLMTDYYPHRQGRRHGKNQQARTGGTASEDEQTGTGMA